MGGSIRARDQCSCIDCIGPFSALAGISAVRPFLGKADLTMVSYALVTARLLQFSNTLYVRLPLEITQKLQRICSSMVAGANPFSYHTALAAKMALAPNTLPCPLRGAGVDL